MEEIDGAWGFSIPDVDNNTSSSSSSSSYDRNRLSEFDRRLKLQTSIADFLPSSVKITSVDSGIETGNDSNDSTVAQSEGYSQSKSDRQSSSAPTKELSTLSSATSFFCSRETPAESGSEIEEIERPLSSMSSNVSEIMFIPNNAGSGPAFVNFFYDSTSVNLSLADKRMAENQLPTFRLPTVTSDWCASASVIRRKRNLRIVHGRFRSKARSREIYGITSPKFLDERRLRVAAGSNDVDQVRRLLEKGVQPNSCDEQLRTPLHLSSGRGYTEVVRLLLKHGANPSLKDCIGNTPLHLAAVTSKISVVTLLLEAGTDPLSTDYHGYNPLQLAETKLRLLQNCKGEDMLRIKSEVHEVVNMLMAFLKNRDGFGGQVDALSTFCSRLTLSNTSDQVQDEVRDLLTNIDSLSLKAQENIG